MGLWGALGILVFWLYKRSPRESDLSPYGKKIAFGDNFSRFSAPMGRYTLLRGKKEKATPMTFPAFFLRMAVNVLAVFLVGMIFVQTISSPLLVWDEMARWILQAKSIFHHKQLDLEGIPSNYYPILWPVHIGALFSLIDGTCDEIAKWSSALLFLAFITQLRGALAFLNIKLLSWGGMILLYLLFFYHWVFSTALPENVFLAFLTATIAAVLGWLQDTNQRKYLSLAVMMALGVSLTKFEGVLFPVICGVSLLILKPRLKLSAKDTLWVCTFFLSAFVPMVWIAWVKLNGYFQSVYHLQNGIQWANVQMNFSVFFKILQDIVTIQVPWLVDKKF